MSQIFQPKVNCSFKACDSSSSDVPICFNGNACTKKNYTNFLWNEAGVEFNTSPQPRTDRQILLKSSIYNIHQITLSLFTAVPLPSKSQYWKRLKTSHFNNTQLPRNTPIHIRRTTVALANLTAANTIAAFSTLMTRLSEVLREIHDVRGTAYILLDLIAQNADL